MQKVVDNFDTPKYIGLSVVSYNERAESFFHKWGFEKVPGSESLFAVKIPEIEVRRNPK